VKFAYADPPYLGRAGQYYGELHPDAAAYDRPEKHRQLIDRLCSEFDGWAMSLHSPSLREILPMCPPDVRVAAWTKPFASYKKGVNPGYAWEPVIFRGARRRTGGTETTIPDYCAVPITLRRGFQGAKPERFVWWVLALLGVRPEDEFVDLYPGSGAVARAWERWKAQQPLGLTA
jgi:hypothetical protein